MIKIAEGAFGAISGWFKEHPAVVAGLLGGGLGATAGALFPTGDEDEEPSERLKRRIRNALVLGGMGAGAGALIRYGLDMAAKPLDSKINKPSATVSNEVSETTANPWIVGSLAASGAGVGIGARNLAQKDLRGKVMQVAKELEGNGIKVAPLHGKASTGQVRAYVNEILNAAKDAKTGRVPDDVIRALEKQFGQKGKHLLHALQNYGISTSVLENSEQFRRFGTGPTVGSKIWQSVTDANGKIRPGKARKFIYQARKFGRRNKWGALGALLAGGATMGISALTGGKGSDADE